MTALTHLIEIVYDKKKKKLRARSIIDGHWCRFPNNLRKENMIYSAEKMTKSTGDSWIAGGTIKPFPITSDKNADLETMLNLKNKAVLKSFYDCLYNATSKKVNTEMMNILFLIKKIFPTIDEQLLIPAIKNYTHSAFISEDLLVQLQNMLSTYNEKRVIQLFSVYKEDDFLEDTVQMYERLFENNIEIDQILPEKPKSIRELHSLFSRECEKIEVPKNSLKQDLDYLDNMEFSKGLRLFVPRTTHDLITIGNQLQICVGNGLYAQKVLKKQCNIIAIKNEEGKFTNCIEFHKNHIIQGRGYRNSDMTSSSKTKLLELIANKPKGNVA
jgi:hypothetical protein